MAKRKSRKRRNRNCAKRPHKVAPSQERLSKGDVIFTASRIYRASAPTVIDRWKEKQILGSDQRGDERISALTEMMELSAAANLFQVRTSNLERVPHGSTSDEDGITALDEHRHVMGQMPLSSRIIIRQIIHEPYREPCLGSLEVRTAADDLIDALQKRREMWGQNGPLME